MGKFELAVMAAVITLRDNAYGRSLKAELEKKSGKEVAPAQVYVALARLEQQGFVKSETGDPTPVRGGRSKRFYRITSTGLRAFKDERQEFAGLFRALPAESR